MPKMGLGTYIGLEGKVIPQREERLRVVQDTILTALRIGYRHLDLAPAYDNLPAVKDALHQAFRPEAEGGLGLRRDDLWITMKANPWGGVFPVDTLLKDLDLTYFDLFLWHLPHMGRFFDSEENLTNAWQSLANFDSVKLPRIGVSNCYLPHLERLLDVCEKESLRSPFANQIGYNLGEKDSELLAFHQQHQINTIAYSPLGFQCVDIFRELPSVQALAQQVQADPIQAQLAWLMAKDMTVIPASTSEAHLRANFAAIDYVAAVQAAPELAEVLDQAPNFEGMIATIEDAKQHALRLDWNIQHASGMKPY